MIYTEKTMQQIIAETCGLQNTIIPNVSFAWLNYSESHYDDTTNQYVTEWPLKGIHHEADLLWINKNDYLTEIEIKINYNDFLKDFTKKENHMTPFTRSIYYAFPFELYNVKEEDIKSILNEHYSHAGIIVVNPSYSVVVKRPKPQKAMPLLLNLKLRLLKVGCQKWWKRDI